ncbi:type III effector protein [Streptomyces sp. NPDC018019]|uniref:type III effector protein n=1 Tax=Streptomyces sp. NPDC018019 TaxID=3365030 RepID=UPI0037B99AD1
MPPADQPTPPPKSGPASFLAAAAALEAIGDAVRAAETADAGADTDPHVSDRSEHALASLLLLREVREQLAGWEAGLIETAREAGASWADLARPLGVASRQAAERRYLRLRPGVAGTTGEQRVQATRNQRAADRTVNAWARDHASELRRLAGQITALTDLPAAARTPVDRLDRALADNDAARLIAPLAATGPHLRGAHPELADRIHTLTSHTDRLRHDAHHQRRTM